MFVPFKVVMTRLEIDVVLLEDSGPLEGSSCHIRQFRMF